MLLMQFLMQVMQCPKKAKSKPWHEFIFLARRTANQPIRCSIPLPTFELMPPLALTHCNLQE